MAEKIMVVKYKCACGKRYSAKRLAERHEVVCTCWTNPKYKTCKTCVFGEQVKDSNGMEHEPQYLETWNVWECNNPDFNYNIHHNPAHANAPDLCINCTKWESKLTNPAK